MKTHRSRTLVLLTSAVISTAGMSHAAVLVDYSFTAVGGSNTVTPQAATATLTGLASSTFAPILNGSTPANATNMAFSSSGQNAFLNFGSVAQGSTASPGDDYWQFTLTPDGGNSIDYDSLSFLGISPTWTQANTVTWDVRSSADGYLTSLGTDSISSSATTDPGLSVDISSLGTISSALTFRIYNYKLNNTALTGSQMRVDNVVVNGTLIPEPSTAVLGSLALLALMRRRRA